MKVFRTSRRQFNLGFSLVEAAFSLGVLSFGFLSIVPMMGLGLDSARTARERQVGAQIAETLAEQAREGALLPGNTAYDDQGASCAAARAAFRAVTTETTLPGNCEQVTIQVIPAAHPQSPQSYAVVLPNP